MTKGQAEKIFKCFGPGSAMYECGSVDGIMADYHEDSAALGVGEWLSIQLGIESVMLEGSGEVEEVIKGIKTRLVEAGFLQDCAIAAH